MPNLFRHLTMHSHMPDVYLACGMLKQVQHDKMLNYHYKKNPFRITEGIKYFKLLKLPA